MAGTPRFYVWTADSSGSRVCVLLGLAGVPDDFDLDGPGPVAARFGSEAYFPMDPDHPDDDRLADVLHTSDAYAVVSSRVRARLKQEAPDDLEFLPVRIVGHDGAVAAADYFIARPTAVVDGIDLDASDVERHPADPSQISCVDELVLRPDAVGERKAFRLLGLPRFTVVSDALARACEEAGFSGLRLVPVESFEL